MSIRIENPITTSSAQKTEADRIYQQQVGQIQAIKAKLDSLLLSNNVMDANSTRTACCNLHSLSAAEKEQYILQTWGTMYLDRCRPLLSQLLMAEEALVHAAKPVKR